jgi:hypothetical protein
VKYFSGINPKKAFGRALSDNGNQQEQCTHKRTLHNHELAGEDEDN